MMRIRNLVITAVLATAILCSGGFVSAQAIDNSALIAQLQVQIQSLMQQIQQLIAQQQGGGQKWCHTFNNYLVAGISNQETNDLRTALYNDGEHLPIAGSVEGNSFDDDVAAAVVKFQGKYGITQTGTVGPKTRAKLNALYGCGTTPVPQQTSGLTIDQVLNSNGFVNGKKSLANNQVGGEDLSNVVLGQLDSDSSVEAVAIDTWCSASCGKGVDAFKLVNGNVLMTTLPNSGVDGAAQAITQLQIGDNGQVILTETDFSGTRTNYYTVNLVNGALQATMVNPSTTPWITSVNPSQGGSGTQIIIGGVNLSGATSVGFYQQGHTEAAATIPAQNLNINSNNITFVLPQSFDGMVGPGLYTITVVTPTGTAYTNSSQSFNHIISNTTTCKNLYWFDNTTQNCSQQKQFCGSYSYLGLQTFNDKLLCQIGLLQKQLNKACNTNSDCMSGQSCNNGVCGALTQTPITVVTPVGGETLVENSKVVGSLSSVDSQKQIFEIKWTGAPDAFTDIYGSHGESRIAAYLEQNNNGQFTTVGRIIPQGYGSIYWIVGEVSDINCSWNNDNMMAQNNCQFSERMVTPGIYDIKIIDNQTGAVGRSNGFNIAVSPNPSTCVPNWQCQWSDCIGNSQVWTNVDSNKCGSSANMLFCPNKTQQCTSPQSVISLINPSSGSVGSTITITGTNFDSKYNTVNFGCGYMIGNDFSTVPVPSADGKTITTTIPRIVSGAGVSGSSGIEVDYPVNCTVNVNNNKGLLSNSLPFTVTK